MEDVVRLMLSPDPLMSWQTALVSMLLAFLLGTAIAQVYVTTHRGLSYSRSFVQTLVLGAIVSSTLMLAIGNNLARGIGILGTLAIIRFRSSMKDPRDMVFIFAALATGIAVGVRSFAVGILGTVVFSMAAYLLAYTSFGSRRQFDGLVRLQVAIGQWNDDDLRAVLRNHCRRWVLVALREVAQGEEVEHNYHVKLLAPEHRGPFVRELEAIAGVRGVSFFLQEATEEM
jgi:uncharacterized membrane protein YhiD involved in acid resistance